MVFRRSWVSEAFDPMLKCQNPFSESQSLIFVHLFLFWSQSSICTKGPWCLGKSQLYDLFSPLVSLDCHTDSKFIILLSLQENLESRRMQRNL